MKNKYLTKCLCVTLLSAMVLSSPASVYAAAELGQGDTFVSDDSFSDGSGDGSDFTPTPEPVDPTPIPQPEPPTPEPEPPIPTPGPETPTPTPDPEHPDVSPTPSPEVTPTPDPENPNVTPTPSPEVSPTPVPEEALTVEEIVKRLNLLNEKESITLEDEKEIETLRKAYDLLTLEEQVSMQKAYMLLVQFEQKIKELKEPTVTPGPDFDDNSKGSIDVLTGTPVYYTNMVSNLHAGKDFYLDSLKNNYQLSFSEDFASVMNQIETEYKAKNKLSDVSDRRTDGVTTSSDTLLVRNWQDILAVYVYEKSQEGMKSFTLDASCKEDLAAIFAEMNPVVRDKQNITKVTYGNRHINYYIKKHKIPKKDRAVLKKYVETDCKLLCATVTAAKGFVRQSVGDEVSEERVNVISAAYSLVGKVGYFWGGKSTVLGEDPSWGTAAKVSAAGSNSTGTLRAYGLDCSGFVTWAVINGYQNPAMQTSVGDGTSDQWTKANVVSEAEAQPGDLVFQRGPEAGSDNHVGIICGKTDAGDWIAVHCSSGQNGVTVGEAYSASFRYIRQPSFYPTREEAAQMAASGSGAAVTETVTESSGSMVTSSSLQDVIQSNSFTSKNQESLLNNQPLLVDDNDIVVFVQQ